MLRRSPRHGTSSSVTSGAGENGGIEAGTKAAGDSWASIRADDSLQFNPITTPPAEPPPAWIAKLFKWLEELFEPLARGVVGIWPVLKWFLLALVIAALLWLAWQLIAPLLGKPGRADTSDDHWVPEREEALALLEEADRLAAAGDYDEATHLLLKRSVSQIKAARPEWLEPSSTAREIAALPGLPGKARSAFTVISERVERSLFALRRLSVDDWQAARAAYADFALASL